MSVPSIADARQDAESRKRLADLQTKVSDGKKFVWQLRGLMAERGMGVPAKLDRELLEWLKPDGEGT